ncbi:MAG: hypothetical protein IH849_12830 [Acidobacteria bacterium]|nr:hypothetical protein [Acidobacteriota bacterium]
MTSYRQIQAEVDRLRKESADLEQAQAEASAARQAALGKDAQDFSEHEVAECRRTLASIEARQQLIADRVDALEARLPAPEQRRQAGEEARTLVEQAQEAGDRFACTWPQFLETLEAAEALGRELASAREEARAAIGPITSLVARYGIEQPIPDLPAPPGDESRLAGLLAAQCRTVGYHGELNDTAARDLAAGLRREGAPA